MAEPDGHRLISECIRQTSTDRHRQERKRRPAVRMPGRAQVLVPCRHPRHAGTL